MADQFQQQATVTAATIFDQCREIITLDPYEKLMCIHNPDDDSLIRNLPIPVTTLAEDDQNAKDISLNPDRKTSIRLFRPATTNSVADKLRSLIRKIKKLPIIIYFHGGGFILSSAASTIFHNFCQSIATHLTVLVVSVDYRLAPESRLPAAYDDAMDALIWVKNQALLNGEPWLKEYADFSKCFLMGCNSGANIAYHACLRASEMDLGPVKISGLIMNETFMSGMERSRSDLYLIKNKILSLPVSDLMWELSLPIGSNRDHPYCNLLINEDEESFTKKCEFIKKCMVILGFKDPLLYRQIDFNNKLKGKGVKVKFHIFHDKYHGMVYNDCIESELMLGSVKEFIFSEKQSWIGLLPISWQNSIYTTFSVSF